jgi:hypothetical protein
VVKLDQRIADHLALSARGRFGESGGEPQQGLALGLITAPGPARCHDPQFSTSDGIGVGLAPQVVRDSLPLTMGMNPAGSIPPSDQREDPASIRLAAAALANHLACRHVTALDRRCSRSDRAPPRWRRPSSTRCAARNRARARLSHLASEARLDPRPEATA